MVREALNTVTGHPMTILQYQPREIEKALQGFSIPGFFAKSGGHCNLVHIRLHTFVSLAQIMKLPKGGVIFMSK